MLKNLFASLIIISSLDGVASTFNKRGAGSDCIDQDWFSFKIIQIETELPKEFIELNEGKDIIWIKNNSSEPIYELTDKPSYEIAALKVSGTPYSKMNRLKNEKVCDVKQPFILFSAFEWFAWNCSGARNTRIWLYADINPIYTNPSYGILKNGDPDTRQPLPVDNLVEKIFLFQNQIYKFKYLSRATWNPNYRKKIPGCGMMD